MSLLWDGMCRCSHSNYTQAEYSRTTTDIAVTPRQ